MKAIICTGYGVPDVLMLQEIEKPTPKSNQILIKIHATTVTSGDCVVRGAKQYGPIMKIMFGFKRPRQPILGTEFSGIIEEVGENSTKFKVGDAVFALTGMKFGGYAEYICLPENAIVSLAPRNATFEETATLAFGGTTALHFLRKASLAPNQKVLIYGASGSVGAAAIQLATYFGADVTGICSTQNLEFVHSLGANTTIDYTTEEFNTLDKTYDIVFDAVGKLNKSKRKQLTSKNGKFVSVSKGMVKGLVEDLYLLKELVEKERFKATIDRTYSLANAAQAHEYVETGRKKGNVALTVTNNYTLP
ncbi:NAD(P)-dependent alcohol dehydrogenase [Enterococcus sp. AZ101]|uniref:NAD(P)-dependent alcohol dehydrogenase n=1 Tax=Enterococcus sp. AZ101 TaxID=2774742 RepID=UPI003D2C0DB1